MARATRSADSQKSPKHEHKKRKLADESLDEQPDKHQRTDAPPLAATSPIQDQTAAKILHILESIDEQGLLDRVYEPPHSLRSLLQSPHQHSLATLRAAVSSLRPLSSHPRLPVYEPAAQQRRFCDTALSLLDQASFASVSLDTPSLLPDDDESHPRLLTTKRYALMQRLPDGDYFTSANVDLSAAPPENGTDDLKDLPTGHADLVAVLPAPSVTSLPPDLPTLGDYGSGPLKRFVPPPPRRVSHGTFLDYGPNASFAPTWMQDGTEIGMRQMSEYYAQRAKRHKERFLAVREAANRPAPAEKPQLPLPAPSPPIDPDLESLQDILSPNEIDSLTSVLGSLELENSVHELLERNRRTLRRLGQLQTRRLRFEDAKPVKEGDEEWELAQGILSSLTLLASLRPRSSAHPTAPLVPPPDVVHTLMHTLPRAAIPGWHGTLASPKEDDNTPLALRDDSTVRVRPGVPAKLPPPPPPVPVEVSTPGTPVFPPHYQASGYYTPQPQTRAPQPARYTTRATSSLSAGQQQSYYPQQQAAYAGSTTQIPYWKQRVGSVSCEYACRRRAPKAVANTVLTRTPSSWGTGAAPPVLPPHLRSGAVG
ncbi:hypothetical protein C8F01DRAFT_1110280 [Mycena amicta]|nr:hypothetical protein C8F01DRAFT_1110280 [Mycena amicta]